MKEKILIGALYFLMMIPTHAFALETDFYIVQKDDTLWKIAMKYQIDLKDVIESNPQFENPNLIYPNDKVNVPYIKN